MVPTITLTRKYPLGTTGTVSAWSPVALTDTANGGEMPKRLRAAKLTQNTGGGYAQVSIPGVPSTLYPNLDKYDAYVVWGEDLMYDGTPTVTKTAYQTPVGSSKDIDDPTNPLLPLNAGDIHYGIGGVEVNGSGLAAYIHLGKLIIELQSSPDSVLVGTANEVNDTTVIVTTVPNNISSAGGTWAILSPYTVNCEMRRIIAIANGALAFDAPLKKVHATSTPILFTPNPEWLLPLFGAAGGGVVDDTPAFEAAKADLPATGGTIRVPHGVWMFNGVMNQQGMRVIGDAKSSVDDTYPNYVLPWDESLPVVKMSGANGDQVHDMVIRDLATYGGKTAATGLWIAEGTYNAHIDQISCINFIDHCLKIGDINQADLVSKIHINGAVLQPSDTSAANVVTLGMYGNSGARYTTAVFINNMELQQPNNGHGLVCDGAANTYISNSYLQFRDNHCIDFRKTGSRSFPHIYMDNVAIDNGDSAGNANAVSINLIAGLPLLPSYISGTYKVVGKITDGTHTYDAPANMAAAMRDPLMLELWVLGGFRLADVNNPEFASAPNMIASGHDFQLNTFTGGGIFLRPNNRDTYALRILANTGPVLPTFLSTAKPDANLWPGSLIQVSNEAGGAPIEFSTPRTYTLTLAGAPTGGYFTITVVVAGGAPATTTHLSYNATASEVQAALQALINIGDNNVTVKAQSGLTGGSVGWVLTPAGTLIGNTVAFTFDITTLTGGSGVGLTYITTLGAWEQVASRNRDNGFLAGQGMRAALSASVASGLYVPWITGDTTSTLYAGRNDATNNQTALRGMSGSGTGAWGESITGDGGFFRSQTGLPLRVHAWNDVVDNYTFVSKFFHRALGALPLAGIGTAFGLYADTTSAGTTIHQDDLIYHVVATHPVATTAAFTGDVKHYATDYGHSWLGWEMLADGALKQGWFGKVPVVQQASAAHASDLATVIALTNALAQGLINFGLFATSTGFSAPSNAPNSSVTEADPADPLDYDEPNAPDDNYPAPAPDRGGGAPTGYTPDTVYTGGV